MTTLNSNAVQLLEELSRAPVEQRADVLREHGPVEPALSSLIDHAAQLTAVDASRAVEATDIVVNLADRLGSQLDRARARRARARALSYSGRFDDALAVAREGARLAEEAGHAIEAGRARLASMHALGEMGRLEEAIRVGEAARQAFIAAGEPALAARADINLGTAHQRRDEPDKAVECFERAKPHLMGEPLIIGHLENNRGEALLALNDFEGAEAAFRAALAAFQNAKAALTAAIAEGNLADLAARQGHLHDALYHFEQARRYFESDRSAGHLARLLAEQADALAVLGMPHEALAQYETALNMLDRCGLALEAARARCGMGKTLMRLNRRAQAETALAAAAAAFGELGHATLRAKVDLVRAELASSNGRPTEARAMIWRALAALHDKPADLAVARYLLGKLAMESGRFEEAHSDFNAGLAAACELELAPLQADLLFARGSLFQKQNKLERAIDDFSAAVRQVERLRGALQAERFRAAFLGDRSTIYESLVLALLGRNNSDALARAFTIVEQAKSRSLLERVQGLLRDSQPLEESGDRTLLAEMERVRGELNALYSRLGDERQHSPTSDHNWRESIRGREQQLNDLETRLSATSGVGVLYSRTADLTSVQRLLPAESALVEYFIAGDELLAFVVDNEGVEVFRKLATVTDLVSGLQRLQFQMNRALRPGATSGARGERLLADAIRELAALDKMVMQPLRSSLARTPRLFIVPHGPLHVLPFHALWNGRGHLLESHEIRYAPSASLLVQWLSKNGQRANQNSANAYAPLLIAVHDENAPQIATEAQLVARSLQCPEHRTLIGSKASVKRVKSAAADASLIHFACHGRFAADTPLGSGLKLADRWLTVRDVFSLRLRADLVTLSGCETGLTAVHSGDELMGLVRGFLAAGAESLLVSLWRVDDQSTAEFMAAFYERYITRQNSASTCLRETQREFLAKYQHPALWAPFMLVGGGTIPCKG